MHRILRDVFISAGDAAGHAVAFQGAQSILGFWLVLMETCIILGALWTAAEALDSPLMWVLYAVGYLALGLYILTSMNYLMSKITERYVTARSIAGWAVASVTPFIISRLANEFISAGLGLS